MITRPGPDGVLAMRCISLKQPYPYLMFDLPPEHRKPVENRTRVITQEMGPMLVASSAKLDLDYYAAALDHARARGVPEALLPRPADLPLGVLYGVLRFDQMLPPESLLDALHPWKFPGHVGYVCGAALRLQPRAIKGAQTIYYVPLTVAEQQLLRDAALL